MNVCLLSHYIENSKYYSEKKAKRIPGNSNGQRQIKLLNIINNQREINDISHITD